MNMQSFFSVGDVIRGFCNGFFGRDDYEEKVCILCTTNYAVFQYLTGSEKGFATILNDPKRLNMEMVNLWKQGENE